MAESPDPRRPRSAEVPPVESDSVYDLDGAEDDRDAEPARSGLAPGADSPFDEPLEADETEHRRPSAPSSAPLPRLWKAEPEPEPEEAPRKKRGKPAGLPEKEAPVKKARASTSDRSPSGGIERIGTVTKQSDKQAASRKPKRERDADREADREGKAGSVLIEETPSLDTYETRRTIRILVGVGVLSVGLLIGFVTLGHYLSGPSSTPEPPAPPTAAVAAPLAPNPELVEQEARALFERARGVAKRGEAKRAVTLLTKVTTSYPNTQTAREAREALDRPAKNLPLFLDRPAVVATALSEAPRSVSEATGPNVVEATPATAPLPTSGEVGLVLPANPAEASRSPGAMAVVDNAPPVGRPLPPGFRSRPGTQAHESGWALEIVGDRDGAPMVLVPGGTFTMGRDDGDPAERPAHPVRLSTFYVDQHEVTVRQFELFQREANRRGDRDRALAREGSNVDASDDSPVVMVTAKDAKDYAGWAGKRLPTEAQWEMAARGPDGRIYPWGIHPPDWGKKREPRQIGPVLSFAVDVSPFGAYDMAGNAWEWTKDWYDAHHFQLFKRGQVIDDPSGPLNRPRPQELAVKGGSKTWTASKREGVRWDKRLPYLGFRCVLPVEGPDNAFQPAVKPAPSAPGDPGAVAPGMPGGPPPF